jgi:hypothetical protein
MAVGLDLIWPDRSILNMLLDGKDSCRLFACFDPV